MEIVLKGAGANDPVLMQVDPTHRAARVSLRPAEKGVYGSYSAAFATSGAFTAGAVANGVLLALQWNIKGASMLLRRLWGGVSATTAFAQGDISMDAIRATGLGNGQYTGGQVLNLAGKSFARSTRFPSSLLLPVQNTATGSIAVASNVALTAPSTAWTFESGAFGRLTTSGTLGLPLGLIFEARSYDEPEEFQNGEGMAVRLNCPATGVINPAVVIVEWDEVDPNVYFK